MDGGAGRGGVGVAVRIRDPRRVAAYGTVVGRYKEKARSSAGAVAAVAWLLSFPGGDFLHSPIEKRPMRLTPGTLGQSSRAGVRERKNRERKMGEDALSRHLDVITV